MAVRIELGNGASFDMEDTQWKIVATATALQVNGAAITRRLVVRTNAGHGVLVYVETESHDTIVRTGELLPPESPGIIHAMQSLAALYGLPSGCFDSCLEQLYRK